MVNLSLCFLHFLVSFSFLILKKYALTRSIESERRAKINLLKIWFVQLCNANTTDVIALPPYRKSSTIRHWGGQKKKIHRSRTRLCFKAPPTESLGRPKINYILRRAYTSTHFIYIWNLLPTLSVLPFAFNVDGVIKRKKSFSLYIIGTMHKLKEKNEKKKKSIWWLCTNASTKIVPNTILASGHILLFYKSQGK